jgi:hypothetical protein
MTKRIQLAASRFINRRTAKGLVTSKLQVVARVRERFPSVDHTDIDRTVDRVFEAYW